MANDINTAVTEHHPNPFVSRGLPSHVSAGAVAIESERAIAEAQGKLVIAKRFPRNQADAYQRVMEACSRQGLAEEAMYAFSRGGASVTGPSIRLAEELARCWGNIDYGLRELSRRSGESEMEAFAWDLETNTMTSQKFTVKHIRDTRGGKVDLTDERDIYEIGANMGARRLRARLLAILPPDLVDAAVTRCKATLQGKSDTPMADRIRGLVDAFAGLGVRAELIERKLGKKLDEMLPEELADLRVIYKSIKDGIATAGEHFNASEPGQTEGAATTETGQRRPSSLAKVAAMSSKAAQSQNATQAPQEPAEQPDGATTTADSDF